MSPDQPRPRGHCRGGQQQGRGGGGQPQPEHGPQHGDSALRHHRAAHAARPRGLVSGAAACRIGNQSNASHPITEWKNNNLYQYLDLE